MKATSLGLVLVEVLGFWAGLGMTLHVSSKRERSQSLRVEGNTLCH